MKFDLKVSDLEMRSRSLISAPIQDANEMHLWYKFGMPSYKQSQGIVVTSTYDIKVTDLEWTDQGH